MLIELYSRKVVGHHMRTELCLEVLQRALAVRQPAAGLVHLDSTGLVQRMSRKGNCWDNAVAESFFGTLEQELGGHARWTSIAEARNEVGGWIHEFCNDLRLHSTIGFHSPVEYEALHRASITEAA